MSSSVPPSDPEPQQWTPSPFAQEPVPQPVKRGFLQHPFTVIVGFTILSVAIMVVEAIIWMLVGPQAYRNLLSTQQPSLVVLEAIAASGSLLAYIFIAWVFERRRLATVGFAVKSCGRELSSGLLIGAGLMSAVILAEAATGVYRIRGFNPHLGIGIWLMTFLLTAIFEEVSFRGCVLRVIGERWGTWTGLIVSSIIFGLVHLMNPTPGMAWWQHIAGPLFISLEAGLLMGAAYVLTRKLWMPIGIHWAWNFFEGPIYGTGVSGIAAPSLIHAKIHGPFLLTGGSFGPEAGLPCLIICTLAAVAMIRKTQRAGRWDLTQPWRDGPMAMPVTNEADAG